MAHFAAARAQGSGLKSQERRLLVADGFVMLSQQSARAGLMSFVDASASEHLGRALLRFSSQTAVDDKYSGTLGILLESIGGGV